MSCVELSIPSGHSGEACSAVKSHIRNHSFVIASGACDTSYCVFSVVVSHHLSRVYFNEESFRTNSITWHGWFNWIISHLIKHYKCNICKIFSYIHQAGSCFKEVFKALKDDSLFGISIEPEKVTILRHGLTVLSLFSESLLLVVMWVIKLRNMNTW